jgi:signal transduction histidine kinase
MVVTSLSVLLLLTVICAKKKIVQLQKELVVCRQSLNTRGDNKTQEIYRFAEMGRLSSGLVHDLANPVTAVILSLDELEAERGTELLKQIREGVGYIEDCLASARQNLNGQREEQIFCARSEVMRVIGFLEPKATKKGVGINAQLSEVKLYGESSKFGQVVSNLLDNAIDSYDSLSRNGKVDVNLRLEDSNTVVLSVKDDGVGVNQAEISKIFQPFFSTKTELQGTGLGLSITKRIVEGDFGGCIKASSTGSGGATFQAILPIKEFNC